jgi:hypothetical protein
MKLRALRSADHDHKLMIGARIDQIVCAKVGYLRKRFE